jgi:hypothetical protein
VIKLGTLGQDVVNLKVTVYYGFNSTTKYFIELSNVPI